MILSLKSNRSYKFRLNKKGAKELGFLVPLEYKDNIPFEVKRIFYIYDAPKSIERGSHAYHKTKQDLICLSGSLKVKCFDGKIEFQYKLSSKDDALYISPKIWRTTFEHSKDVVLLVLSSLEYDEQDYIRKYDDFLEVVSCSNFEKQVSLRMIPGCRKRSELKS